MILSTLTFSGSHLRQSKEFSHNGFPVSISTLILANLHRHVPPLPQTFIFFCLFFPPILHAYFDISVLSNQDATAKILDLMEGKPDLIIGNYSDGNLVASLMASKLGITQVKTISSDSFNNILKITRFQLYDICSFFLPLNPGNYCTCFRKIKI